MDGGDMRTGEAWGEGAARDGEREATGRRGPWLAAGVVLVLAGMAVIQLLIEAPDGLRDQALWPVGSLAVRLAAVGAVSAGAWCLARGWWWRDR
jgi:hypothetical protein